MTARGAALALAAFALALRILIPPGYMAAEHGPPFALVICTGHGPLVVSGPKAPKAPARKGPEAPCAFAHAPAPLPPPLAVGAPLPGPATAAETAAPRLTDLAPGRGLAAPPPPSRAPPRLPV